jgi:integrase
MARKLPDVITIEQFNTMLKHTTSPIHRAAYKLGFLCGLRVSEVCNLRPEHIDYGRRLIKIVCGKGKKDRFVPLPKPLVRDIKLLPLGRKPRALQIAINKVSEKALGRRIHFHTLRHSCATYYLSKGMDLKQVQVLLGHSRLDTTGIYLHVQPQQLKEKFDELWK